MGLTDFIKNLFNLSGHTGTDPDNLHHISLNEYNNAKKGTLFELEQLPFAFYPKLTDEFKKLVNEAVSNRVKFQKGFPKSMDKGPGGEMTVGGYDVGSNTIYLLEHFTPASTEMLKLTFAHELWHFKSIYKAVAYPKPSTWDIRDASDRRVAGFTYYHKMGGDTEEGFIKVKSDEEKAATTFANRVKYYVEQNNAVVDLEAEKWWKSVSAKYQKDLSDEYLEYVTFTKNRRKPRLAAKISRPLLPAHTRRTVFTDQFLKSQNSYRQQYTIQEEQRQQRLKNQQLRKQIITHEHLRNQQATEQRLRQQMLREQRIRDQQQRDVRLRDQMFITQQLKDQQLRDMRRREDQQRAERLKQQQRVQIKMNNQIKFISRPYHPIQPKPYIPAFKRHSGGGYTGTMFEQFFQPQVPKPIDFRRSHTFPNKLFIKTPWERTGPNGF